MAGIMTPGDEGREVGYQSVPTMTSESGTAKVVAGGNIVPSGAPNYPAESMTSLDGGAYPGGTRMSDATPGDNIN